MPDERTPPVSGRAFATIVRDRIDRMIGTQIDAIERAGAVVADSIAAGRHIWVTGTSHTLHLEATHRAGGLMAVSVLEDVNQLARGDAVLLGISAGVGAEIVDLALEAQRRGARVVALTQLPFETDPRVPPGHPSGRLLHEVADVVIDLGGPFGDGEFELDGTSVAVIPSSGATGVTAMWMVFAEAIRSLAARGLLPRVWQSNLLPGAPARNDAEQAEMLASGLGYVPSRDR